MPETSMKATNVKMTRITENSIGNHLRIDVTTETIRSDRSSQESKI